MPGPARRWAGRPPPKPSTSSYCYSNRAVLRRPLEPGQYASLAFGRRCRETGITPSMGSVGDAYDNAMAESFFATLECELLDRHQFRTHTQARMAVFAFIEGFYNPRRRHSALGQLSPANYERRYVQSTPPSSYLSTKAG